MVWKTIKYNFLSLYCVVCNSVLIFVSIFIFQNATFIRGMGLVTSLIRENLKQMSLCNTSQISFWPCCKKIVFKYSFKVRVCMCACVRVYMCECVHAYMLLSAYMRASRACVHGNLCVWLCLCDFCVWLLCVTSVCDLCVWLVCVWLVCCDLCVCDLCVWLVCVCLCVWLVCDLCVWLVCVTCVCVTCVCDLCVWLVCVTCVCDLCVWLVCVTCVCDLCVWLVCVTCVCDLCVWLYSSL